LSATSNRDSVWIISIYSQLVSGVIPDQSWSRHPRNEPLAASLLGEKLRFLSAEPAIMARLASAVKWLVPCN
jgi:hypothetical protein